MTHLDALLSVLFGLLVAGGFILLYEILRALLFALRSKFIPAYYIQTLRCPLSPAWYWETVQSQGSGDHRFSFKEAQEFKALPVYKHSQDYVRIVLAVPANKNR